MAEKRKSAGGGDNAAKRRRTGSSSFAPPDTSLQARLQEAKKLLAHIMQHKYGWPFNQPVDPVALEIPDYFSIITHPMDLGTIKSNLERGAYETVEDFAEDVRLVWSNALKYNQPGSDIVIMAKELKSIFDKKWATLTKRWAKQDASIPVTPQSTPTTEQSNQSTSTVKKQNQAPTSSEPVPKLVVKPPKQEPAKRMTWEEKRQLCIMVNNLETKYLPKVLLIIHKGMTEFPKVDRDSDEVEINIECLDDGTLRELENYAKEVAAEN
eukprot:TRINITY_DN5078_c0_g1_i2.p1 TRINITY_DN5078_c0_g1~~TRINITY_DN5078_c0_g1_i2.p1  ORF type:complete len:283 (+),score=71.43 TRINITY_DN5078_c0_g1_i2:49-849(+)